MADAAGLSLPTAATARWRPTGEAGRWLLIAGMSALDLIGLPACGIEADWWSLLAKLEVMAVFTGYGIGFDQLRRRVGRLPTLQLFCAIAGDFCFSAVQLAFFMMVAAPVTYIAASVDMPLADRQLAMIDQMLGFDWAGMRGWVSSHPALEATLRWSYFTPIAQSLVLMVLGSFWRPGHRNGQLISAVMTSLLICSAASVILPALSMGGDIASYQPVLKALRHGEPMVLSWDRLEGLISFPSFHAALAVIYIDAARHRLWALIPFAALNALMIAATPPIGGHYLVDTIAGIGVALVSIAAARRLQPASTSVSDSRLALPPAAVVSTDTTRSTANRAR